MYLTLLRDNRNFRLLYIGQAISQLGDWFNAVAVYALLLDLTGSATAVAWMLITQYLPVALVGPLAGVMVDRVNRRRLMIAADLFRGVLVLGLLFVRSAESVWIAYVVTALAMSASAFFEPARTATIPNVTSTEELLPANALAAATWSAMLAIGASVGGLVTAWLGRDVAFVMNAASFFISAIFIARTHYDATPAVKRGVRLQADLHRPAAGPANHLRQGYGGPPKRSAKAEAGPHVSGLAALTGATDLVDGLRYIRRESHVAALMCVKAGWGLAGGVLLLLTVFGQRVFPMAGGSAAGIGVLYGARGVGAGLGPIALRWILGQNPKRLRRAIGPAFFMVGVFYMAIAGAPSLPLAALCVLFAHFGGSILWVFSTVLLQLEVPDQFRGRVFAAELALVTLVTSLSSYLTAYGLDHAGWSPRTLAFILGALFCVPGTLWLVLQARWREPVRVLTSEF